MIYILKWHTITYVIFIEQNKHTQDTICAYIPLQARRKVQKKERVYCRVVSKDNERKEMGKFFLYILP